MEQNVATLHMGGSKESWGALQLGGTWLASCAVLSYIASMLQEGQDNSTGKHLLISPNRIDRKQS